jgi:hypothetical protein
LRQVVQCQCKKPRPRMDCFVKNIIVIYLVGSKFIPANFPLPYFARQIIDSAHLFPWIRFCPI